MSLFRNLRLPTPDNWRLWQKVTAVVAVPLIAASLYGACASTTPSKRRGTSPSRPSKCRSSLRWRSGAWVSAVLLWQT